MPASIPTTVELRAGLALEFESTFTELARATKDSSPELSAKALRHAMTLGVGVEALDESAVERDDVFDLADRLTLIAEAVGVGEAYVKDRAVLVPAVRRLTDELAALRRFRDRATSTDYLLAHEIAEVVRVAGQACAATLAELGGGS